MAGSCWRLLAAFSLILVLRALLRGQDGGDRPPVAAAVFAPQSVPYQARLPYSPTAPVWITPPPVVVPGTPGRPPVGYSPIGHPPIAPGSVFKQLVRSAGIIFSGRVTFIGPPAAASGQDRSSTTVTFQVEHALRGASSGQNLTIHEWAGLWASGERYRVGERVLLFLYAPSKLGLTSPVGGGEGRFAMDSQGQIVMSQRHVVTLAEDPILGGKAVIQYADFALAIRRSSGQE
jgi:hypothetical protein